MFWMPNKNDAMKTAAALLAAYAVLTACWVYPGVVFSHAATTNTVLFDREIVRILDEHCVMCHVEGGPSFSLATYEETWLNRNSSYQQILAGHMPPWAAVSGYGEFTNANNLTLREKRFLVSWVEGLGPRNRGTVFLNVLDPDAALREEISAQIDFEIWVLGEPDLEVRLPALVPARITPRESQTRIQRMVFDPGLASESWVSALEYHPGNRSAIRAVVFSLNDTGQWLATWTPWHGFRRLPGHIAWRIAAGARIVAEVHTSEPGQAILEPGQLGLYFADKPAPVTPSDIVLTASGEVPPGTNTHRLHAETLLATDTRVLALWPKLPAGVESIEVSARLPNGRVEILLFALDIPLTWPTPYIYERPVDLPGGSRLSLTAYLSNSSAVAVEQHVQLTISATQEFPDP